MKTKIRNLRETDLNFIFSTWMRIFKDSQKLNFARGVVAEIYKYEQHELIEDLLRTCQTRILCPEADEDLILCYIVFEIVHDVPVIHWICTREQIRNSSGNLEKIQRRGFAKYLLQQCGFNPNDLAVYSHRTDIGDRCLFDYEIMEKDGKKSTKSIPKTQWFYNPYLINRERKETIDDQNTATPSGDRDGNRRKDPEEISAPA